MLRNKNTLVVILALYWGLGQFAVAQFGNDVDNSMDYSTIGRFSRSFIVGYEYIAEADYLLALGALERSGSEVVPENSMRLQGELTRITYEVRAGYSVEEVYDFFTAQLITGRQSELFSCQGRMCGRSTFWANDIFSNRILFGPDRNQRYLAVIHSSGRGAEDKQVYVALYVTMRGNKKVYAHLDVLSSESALRVSESTSDAELMLELQKYKSIILSDIVFDNDVLNSSTDFTKALRLLKGNPSLSVYVVSHLHGSGDLDSLLQRSQVRAEVVKSRLVELGIDAGRLIAKGLGPLAPYCAISPCDERVELVLH